MCRAGLPPEDRVLCELQRPGELSSRREEGGARRTVPDPTGKRGWAVRALGQEQLWGVSQTLVELNCRAGADLRRVLMPWVGPDSGKRPRHGGEGEVGRC